MDHGTLVSTFETARDGLRSTSAVAAETHPVLRGRMAEVRARADALDLLAPLLPTASAVEAEAAMARLRGSLRDAVVGPRDDDPDVDRSTGDDPASRVARAMLEVVDQMFDTIERTTRTLRAIEEAMPPRVAGARLARG